MFYKSIIIRQKLNDICTDATELKFQNYYYFYCIKTLILISLKINKSPSKLLVRYLPALLTAPCRKVISVVVVVVVVVEVVVVVVVVVAAVATSRSSSSSSSSS